MSPSRDRGRRGILSVVAFSEGRFLSFNRPAFSLGLGRSRTTLLLPTDLAGPHLDRVEVNFRADSKIFRGGGWLSVRSR